MRKNIRLKRPQTRGKIFFAGALVTLAFLGGTGSYKIWQRKEIEHLQTESTVIETALGLIEYRMTGHGPATLIAHGSPGGYDLGAAFARMINSQQYTFIALSRPGYLRTPLASGASPEEQADLYAALLDTLGIQQASIIGISGGSPSAIQFAVRHADRCRSLAIVSGVAQRYSEEELKQTLPVGRRLFRQFYGRLTLFDPFLYLLLPFARLVPDGFTLADLLRSVMLYHLRKTGYENDIAHFAAIESYPLENIIVPTFIVHGTKDDEVPFEHAKLLARSVPGAQLLAIEGGNHMVFYTKAGMIMPILRDFLAA